MWLFYLIGVFVIFFLTDKYYPKYKKKNEGEGSKVETITKTKTNRLRFYGYYYCCKRIYSHWDKKETDCHFLLVINNKGFGVVYDDENEINIGREEFFEFQEEEVEASNLNYIPKYTNNKGVFGMKIYEGEMDNVNMFRYWTGIILEDKLILNIERSYFNDALQDYTVDTILKDLEFNFIKMN
jgi:hypothetical protein